VAGSGEHSNEPLGSIRAGNFLTVGIGTVWCIVCLFFTNCSCRSCNYICIVFIVCSVPFIVCVVLCDVFFFYFVGCVLFVCCVFL
jgi:hypothetical protein